MLNYIWLSLLIIGILVAVGNDWHDLSVDTYHNGERIPLSVRLDAPPAGGLRQGSTYAVTVLVPSAGRPATAGSDTLVVQKAKLTPGAGARGVLEIALDNRTPSIWRERATAVRKDALLGIVNWEESLNVRSEPADGSFSAHLVLDEVKFTHLNAVTNDGFIKYAKSAVELAIGLIGIMALWLGVMKIAEQSGLVAKLASLLRPVTTRLFPDVPPDHPAMGAMIMNISANMLGLSNAATPLGLKAMEELDKLNTKAGTATDAMCTFLVINTSNIQIIPATVIALRAASGSSNPTEILGPVIFATAVAMVVGVTTVKLLAKIPFYRRQLAEGAR